jgi:RNA polymerase sigma factor (sigma-70 family)
VSVVPPPEYEEEDHAASAAPAHTDVAALYQRYHGTLLRQAMSVLPAHLKDQASDARTIVFTRLIQQQRAGTLTEQPNWEAYLVKAVKRACFDIIKITRKSQPTEQTVPDDADMHRAVPPDPTGDTAAERLDDAAQGRRARAALHSLPPRLREIVIARLGGRSYRDIGKEVGLTGQRVGQLYDEAMHALRKEVNRSNG